jgi:uncharacterized protein YndB with AHSA1/START domain
MISNSIEIDRSAEDVFAYLDQLDRHGEWQPGLVSATIEGDGPVGVGTRVREKRKGPGSPEYTYEVTEHDPPRKSSFRGLDGPIRPVGTVTVEPLGEGKARATVEFELEGHGIGKLLAPFARMQAKKQVPQGQQKLKQILEAGA